MKNNPDLTGNNSKYVVPLLASLVIVLVILGLSMSSPTVNRSKVFERDVTMIETVSKSDDISAIEDELNATNFDDLDKELPMIESELN